MDFKNKICMVRYIFDTCLCVTVSESDLQGASYLLVYVQYPAACSLFEAGLQLSFEREAACARVGSPWESGLESGGINGSIKSATVELFCPTSNFAQSRPPRPGKLGAS